MDELLRAYEAQIDLLKKENALLRQLSDQRRLKIAELEYYQHHYDLLFKQPWSFAWWRLRCLMFGERY
jgi:hypothetical protein